MKEKYLGFFSSAWKQVSLFCTIIDGLQTGEEIDENDVSRKRNYLEVLELVHQIGSPQFWDKMQPTLTQDPSLKRKIKKYLEEESTFDFSFRFDERQEVLELLMMKDAEIACDSQELTALILQFKTTCHCVDNEWRDGPAPIVTIQEIQKGCMESGRCRDQAP